MRILTVILENIRSHMKSKIDFTSGFNCLVGGLGTGKSSILYAIDFALFGDPIGRSYNYLLREESDIGKVALKFLHNNKEYTIIRALRRKDKGISQDMEQLKFFEGEKLIASHRNEAVIEQLKAITGLDKEIFRELIWVRQEHLKELLDVRPRERQQRLDQLFGLSDYEQAWTVLGALKRDYETKMRTLKQDPDVVSLNQLEKEYNSAVEELAKIDSELQILRKRFVEVEAALQHVEKRLKSLEELRAKAEDSIRQQMELQAKIENLKTLYARINEQIQSKQSLVNNLANELNSLELKEKEIKGKLESAGLNPDQPMESLKNYLLTLDEQMTQIRAEHENAMARIREVQRKQNTLADQNLCPLCLQPLTGEYKQSLIQRLNKEKEENQQTLAALQNEMEELKALRNLLAQAISDLQMVQIRKEGILNQLKREKKALDELSLEFNEMQRQEESLYVRLNQLKSEVVEFDLNMLEKVRKERDEIFKQYSSVKGKLETFESRKAEVGKRIDLLKSRLDNAQRKLNEIKQTEQLLELIDVIRGAYRNIQPKLRTEFINFLQSFAQQILDSLAGDEGSQLTIKIDETYTPFVIGEEGYEREVSMISGGERTLLAFAYRLGLGQLIMQSRTGHGLHILILDEPTESLGREDGSIDRLAEAISRLKAIEQIIAVTHSEAFAEKAEHVIRLEKEAGVSQVRVEEKTKL